VTVVKSFFVESLLFFRLAKTFATS